MAVRIEGLPSFVDNGRKQPFNPLVETQTYNKLGKNAFFEAKPAVAHFGGFQIHHVHKQEIRILNVSRDSKRLHVVKPTSPFFRIQYKKKGLIAPGMSEDITVEFAPTEYRYYYDCVRIHSEDENLVIPLHGYPVLNTIDFPRIIDFKQCPLRQRRTKLVQLGCKVPIEFEFEIQVLEPNPDFQVYPTSGIIPANGMVTVEVAFTPTKFSTSSMRLSVNVSQLNFEPFTVTVMGSSAPGLVKEMEQSSLRMSSQMSYSEEYRADTGGVTVDITQHPDVKKMIEGKANLNKKKIETLLNRSLLQTGEGPLHSTSTKKLTKKPRREDEEEEEKEIKGIRFPKELDSNFSVSYVLTQQPGKLKIKVRVSLGIGYYFSLRKFELKLNEQDLKRTIGKHKEEKRKRDEAQQKKGNRLKMRRPSMILKMLGGAMSGAAKTKSVLTEGTLVSGVSEADIRHILTNTEKPSRQTKELMFKQMLQEADASEKEKSVRWFVCVGRSLMEENEIKGVFEARNKAASRAEQIADLLAGQRKEAVASKERVIASKGREERVSPTFDPFINDFFRVRKEVLDRFVQKIRVLTMRYRVDTRLRAIKSKLRAKGMTLQQMTSDAVVQQQSSITTNAYADEKEKKKVAFAKETPTSVPLSKPAINSAIFPLYVESEFRQLRPVSVPELRQFEDWEFLKLKVPVYYKTMGYTQYSLAVVPKPLPTEAFRPLLQGAEDEVHPYAPRGQASDGPAPWVDNDAMLTLPSALIEPLEYPLISPAIPSTNALTVDEASTEHALRPRVFTVEDPYLHEDLCGSVEAIELAYKGTHALSSVYRQRKELDSALELSDVPDLLPVSAGESLDAFGTEEVDDEEEATKIVNNPPKFEEIFIERGDNEETGSDKSSEKQGLAAVRETAPPMEEGELVLHERVVAAERAFLESCIKAAREL